MILQHFTAFVSPAVDSFPKKYCTVYGEVCNSQSLRLVSCSMVLVLRTMLCNSIVTLPAARL